METVPEGSQSTCRPAGWPLWLMSVVPVLTGQPGRFIFGFGRRRTGLAGLPRSKKTINMGTLKASQLDHVFWHSCFSTNRTTSHHSRWRLLCGWTGQQAIHQVGSSDHNLLYSGKPTSSPYSLCSSTWGYRTPTARGTHHTQCKSDTARCHGQANRYDQNALQCFRTFLSAQFSQWTAADVPGEDVRGRARGWPADPCKPPTPRHCLLRLSGANMETPTTQYTPMQHHQLKVPPYIYWVRLFNVCFLCL